MSLGSGSGAGFDEAWRPNRDDHCYRHRDRLSFVLCQRCGRTVCGDCQTSAPVGVICPECMKAERAARTPQQRRAAGSAAGSRFGGTAVAWIMGATSAVSIVQLALALVLGRDVLGDALDFSAIYAHFGGGRFEPWRLLTYSLVHGSLLHLAFNMLTLWFFGRAVERALGLRRFLLLYVASVLAGAAAVALLAPFTAVIGASGGIYGLMAAAFFVIRRSGESTRTLLVLIGLNLAFGFFGGGISWQAHIGGLLVGALAGWLLLRDADRAEGAGRGRSRFGVGEAIVAALSVALLLAPLGVTLLYRAGSSF